MRVIVLMIDDADGRATSRRRRSASAATPARARSSCCARYGDAGERTRRASSPACCCPTRPSSPGGRTTRRRSPSRLADRPHRAAPHHGCRHAADPSRTGSPRSATTYAPGDTDLAWTRLTHWREQLAAVLDQPPYEPVTAVEVRGAASSPSTALLAAWLRLQLDVPVDWRYLPSRRVDRRHQVGPPDPRRAATSLLRALDAGDRRAHPARTARRTTSCCRAAPCASASPRSSVASIPTSCMVE